MTDYSARAVLILNEKLSAAEARAERLRAALEPFVKMADSISADLRATHRERADAASEWMREDDRDLRNAFRAACDAARSALAEPAGGEVPNPRTAVTAWQKLIQHEMAINRALGDIHELFRALTNHEPPPSPALRSAARAVVDLHCPRDRQPAGEWIALIRALAEPAEARAAMAGEDG